MVFADKPDDEFHVPPSNLRLAPNVGAKVGNYEVKEYVDGGVNVYVTEEAEPATPATPTKVPGSKRWRDRRSPMKSMQHVCCMCPHAYTHASSR